MCLLLDCLNPLFDHWKNWMNCLSEIAKRSRNRESLFINCKFLVFISSSPTIITTELILVNGSVKKLGLLMSSLIKWGKCWFLNAWSSQIQIALQMI